MSPCLAGLMGAFRPDQKMRNWIAREMAKGSSRIPAYTPYLAPKWYTSPRMPGRTDHSASFEGWKRNSKQAKRKLLPQELSIQAWLMYHLRFLFATEGCETFDAFGGLCAQFNLLGVALNLSVAEGVSFGVAYFRILPIRLVEMARQRAVGADEFIRLLTSEQLGVKEQARRECALSARGDPSKGFPRREKGKNGWSRPTFDSSADPASSAKAAPYRPVFVTDPQKVSQKGKNGWRG